MNPESPGDPLINQTTETEVKSGGPPGITPPLPDPTKETKTDEPDHFPPALPQTYDNPETTPNDKDESPPSE